MDELTVDNQPPKCTWTGCSRRKQTKGLCLMHYQRQYRGQDMNTPPQRRPSQYMHLEWLPPKARP